MVWWDEGWVVKQLYFGALGEGRGDIEFLVRSAKMVSRHTYIEI